MVDFLLKYQYQCCGDEKYPSPEEYETYKDERFIW